MKSKKKSKNDISELEQLKNQLSRALADYDNLRKRTDQEKDLWIKFSSERILVKLLPILDMLESAQEHLKDQGLAISLGEFKNILSEEGIEEINPKKGDKFDENLHEATEITSGGKKGTISKVSLKGYKFSDEGKVIRYAKVEVFK